MQAGPAKAVELFTRLANTSDAAVKTRERLFSELKAELDSHLQLEEKHLFPVLRKQAETKDLVAAALRDNKDLRAMLSELEALPKNDAAFLPKIAEMQKLFRQHARDEKRELRAVQKALNEDQLQAILEKMEESLADAEQRQQVEAEERRTDGRRERQGRDHSELQTVQEQQQPGEPEHDTGEEATEETVGEVVQTTAKTVDIAAEALAQPVQRAMTAASNAPIAAAEHTAAAASIVPRTGFLFWDAMLGLSGASFGRTVESRAVRGEAPAPRQAVGEEVIPLAEEVLVVGKQTVNTGTTRIRRYVVETPVQQEVSLVRERVVVERRRPVAAKPTGETLTEMTIEVVETDEVPLVAKSVQLREEIVIRTERSERVETVRDVVRQDEVEVKESKKKKIKIEKEKKKG